MTELPAADLPEDIKTMRFLVAEKNPSLQKNVVAYLQNAGVAQVEAVKDGAMAWDLWQENRKIDVFVCAANLAELRGLELLAKLRGDKDAPNQPAFLLVSADKSEEAQEEALTKGIDAFLGKPFSQEQLIPKVAEAVAARRKSSGRGQRLSLEEELMASRLPVELIFDRYSTEVECHELSTAKAVIQVTNNYGLGTQLNMRFSRLGGDPNNQFKPLKGTVMKTERIPGEVGVFRLHVQFNVPVKDSHGVPELIRYATPPEESR